MKNVTLMMAALVFSACATGEFDDESETKGTLEEIQSGPVSKSTPRSERAENPWGMTCSAPSKGHDPNGIHNLGQSPHFEGWYYRITHPERNESWVLIAAYWMDKGQRGRAFVELIHSPSGTSYTQVIPHFDIDEVQNHEGEFAIKVDQVFLSADRIKGVLKAENGQDVYLDLDIDGCARWGAPDDERNRWTMGWATEAPFVPLRWHVHHLKAFVTGTIDTGANEWRVDGYPMHQEKNWGRAFPTSWVWFQSNQFSDRPDVALVAAGGPIFPSRWSPDGYMIGLRWMDQFFTWRTQDTHLFPDVDFHVDDASGMGLWRLVGENYRHRIEISVKAPADELIPIHVPTDDGLKMGAVEHLGANMEVSLFRRQGLSWVLMDTFQSTSSAVEAGGEFARNEGLIP